MKRLTLNSSTEQRMECLRDPLVQIALGTVVISLFFTALILLLQ